MKKDALETMFEFVKELDPDKAYDLLMDALAVEFPSGYDEETGDRVYAYPSPLPKVAIFKGHDSFYVEGADPQELTSFQEGLHDAVRDTSREAQQRIRKIISDGTEAINLELGRVTSFATQEDAKFNTHFILDGGRGMKADDIVFAFVLLVEQSDHARCKHCGNLFIGTRGGRKEYCTESCRVARFQKNKRATAKKEKEKGRRISK